MKKGGGAEIECRVFVVDGRYKKLQKSITVMTLSTWRETSSFLRHKSIFFFLKKVHRFDNKMKRQCSLCLAVVALVFILQVHSQLVFMTQNEGIPDKMAPIIQQVVTSIVSDDKQGLVSSEALINIIRKDIQIFSDKWNAMKENSSFILCCQCRRCVRYIRACGRTCCVSGNQGCICRSCISDNKMEVTSIEQEMTSSQELWLKSAKEQLRSDVSSLLNGPGNGKCCLCAICKQNKRECFLPTCCARGGKLCKCFKCSGQSDLLPDLTSNSVLLDQDQDDVSLEQLDFLVDQLLVLASGQ